MGCGRSCRRRCSANIARLLLGSALLCAALVGSAWPSPCDAVAVSPVPTSLNFAGLGGRRSRSRALRAARLARCRTCSCATCRRRSTSTSTGSVARAGASRARTRARTAPPSRSSTTRRASRSSPASCASPPGHCRVGRRDATRSMPLVGVGRSDRATRRGWSEGCQLDVAPSFGRGARARSRALSLARSLSRARALARSRACALSVRRACLSAGASCSSAPTSRCQPRFARSRRRSSAAFAPSSCPDRSVEAASGQRAVRGEGGALFWLGKRALCRHTRHARACLGDRRARGRRCRSAD